MDIDPRAEGSNPGILGGRPVFSGILPVVQPALPGLESLRPELLEILSNGLLTNGKHVQEFEQAAARYLGVEHAVAVSSCTLGLMLVIKALGLQGEVIIPSFTFSATVHAAAWNGLKPVFADCDPETFNVDPDSVEQNISPDTSAILGVHIFGLPCEVEALTGIAQRKGLKLIFDAAHGFGASYRGKRLGGFGDAEVFSLTPTKTVVAGEGGLVLTRDPELARRVRIGRNYGDPGSYDCEFSGLNARMAEFNAILGKKTLQFLDENLASRERWANLYKERMAPLPGISFQRVPPYSRTTYKDFTILVEPQEFGLDRDALALALEHEHIMTKKYFYPPQHLQKAYRHIPAQFPSSLRITEHVSARTLSLPLFPGLGEERVAGVCRAIERIHLHAAEIAKLSR